MFRVHPCLWHPCEPMRRMKPRFPHIVSKRQILHSVRRSIEVILERVTSDVSCGSQATRPWISREIGDSQKWWTCWWAQPLGCTRLNAVTQWHRRWEYPWVKHGETAGIGGNENMKGVGIVWVGTRDVYASDVGDILTKPKPMAKSSQATGQQAKKLSTGEPRIWLNPQNWFGENTSDYQVMHGQNRTGMFYFLRLTIFSTTWTKGHRWARTE